MTNLIKILILVKDLLIVVKLFLDDIKDQVIGIDEVGRGALCGPVVSCSVLLSKKILKNNLVLQINDSKKLNEKKRNYLAKFIKENSIYSIGKANNKEIDNTNILKATNLSMIRAYEIFKKNKNSIKIDGVKTFNLNERTTFIKGGDRKSVCIAAASIVAKVWRDKLMRYYSKIYPIYGWEENKGYGTTKHVEAIKKYGITRIHRKSFLKRFLDVN